MHTCNSNCKVKDIPTRVTIDDCDKPNHFVPSNSGTCQMKDKPFKLDTKTKNNYTIIILLVILALLLFVVLKF
jgi:hypothetical protein